MAPDFCREERYFTRRPDDIDRLLFSPSVFMGVCGIKKRNFSMIVIFLSFFFSIIVFVSRIFARDARLGVFYFFFFAFSMTRGLPWNPVTQCVFVVYARDLHVRFVLKTWLRCHMLISNKWALQEGFQWILKVPFKVQESSQQRNFAELFYVFLFWRFSMQ